VITCHLVRVATNGTVITAITVRFDQ